MITLNDLDEAIKECEGQRNPNANTALKLAAFYTIKNELYPAERQSLSGYSYAPPPTAKISYDSGTEFGNAVAGKDPDAVLEIIDDLMTVLHSAQPRLHNKIVESIRAL